MPRFFSRWLTGELLDYLILSFLQFSTGVSEVPGQGKNIRMSCVRREAGNRKSFQWCRTMPLTY